MADDKADPEEFINKVDDIQSLMKGLVAGDESAPEKVDKYLEKLSCKSSKTQKEIKPARDNTGVNRTVINKDAFDHGPNLAPSMDQESFMAAMEQDSKERAQRRKQRETEATNLKEQGNEHYKAGRYTEALALYTQAIDKVRDWTILYTNRAQTHIKLADYEAALVDCDWALKVFENCLKAYIHQGRAYLGLKEYDKAISSFEKAISIEPKKKNAIQEYIHEVEHARNTAQQESRAGELCAQGDQAAQGLISLLTRLKKPDQPVIYYDGGLRLIAELLTQNADDRTLFRIEGGLHLLQSHDAIAKCLAVKPNKLSPEDLELCCAYYDTMATAVNENEENQRQLLEVPGFVSRTEAFLESDHKQGAALKLSVLNLLLIISQTDLGRAKIMTSFSIVKLLGLMLSLISHNSLSSACTTLLNNLALDKRFKSEMRGNIEDTVLPTFESLMTESTTQTSYLPACISTITNLCGDQAIRHKLSNRHQTWAACVHILERHSGQSSVEPSHSILFSTMALIMNLTYQSCTPTALEVASQFCVPLCHMVISSDQQTEFVERCCATLGHFLPHNDQAVEAVCDLGLTAALIPKLQQGSEDVTRAAMKCLCSITRCSTKARNTLVKSKTGVRSVLSLLHSSDDQVVGNSALCLSHCAPLLSLTDTDVIKDLLVLARDQHRHNVQHNCAILIAKLCQADTRHLERLRELHGIEILHDIIKSEKN